MEVFIVCVYVCIIIGEWFVILREVYGEYCLLMGVEG